MSTSPSSLAAALQPFVDDGIVAGAVLLVADRKGVLALEPVGWADLAARAPMREDSLFWIASMTKPVTGVALMMMVDEGKLSVEDPVSKYIPDFARLQVLREDGKLVPPSRPILVRDVLCHMSGLRFVNGLDNFAIDVTPLKTTIERNLLEPLLADPGAKYIYSNEGTDTAGRIVEILSGMSFDAFVQERILDPLGMRETTFVPRGELLARLAKGYRLPEDKSGLVESRSGHLTYPLDSPFRFAAPGGGLFSVARDVARFGQMLLNEGTFEGKQYLTRESWRQMTVRQTPPHVAESYGFAISASDGKVYGHGGALKTNLTIDHEQVRVFMVQIGGGVDDSPLHAFEEAARRLYPGAGEVPGAAIAGSAAQLPPKS